MPTSYIRILKSFLRIRDRGSCTRNECHCATASPLAVRQRQAAGRPSQHMDGGPRIALRRRCVRRTGLQNLVLHRQQGRRWLAVCRNLRTCTFSLAGINEGRRNWARAASLLQSLLSSASPALPSVHSSSVSPLCATIILFFPSHLLLAF